MGKRGRRHNRISTGGKWTEATQEEELRKQRQVDAKAQRHKGSCCVGVVANIQKNQLKSVFSGIVSSPSESLLHQYRINANLIDQKRRIPTTVPATFIVIKSERLLPFFGYPLVLNLLVLACDN